MVESEVGMVWSRKGGSAPARVPDRPRPLHHLAGRPGRMTLGEVCEHEKTPAVTGVLKVFGVCWVSRKTERVGFDLKASRDALRRFRTKSDQSHSPIPQKIPQKQTGFNETGWDALGNRINRDNRKTAGRFRVRYEFRMPHPPSGHHPTATSRRATH